MQDSILIIDDEKKINSLLARIISLEGFRVLQAFTGKEGLKILKSEDIPVVLSDVKLPDCSGVELVVEIKKLRPGSEIINLTAFGTIADGVAAMRNGAFDYITKGDDNDKIIPLIYKALSAISLVDLGSFRQSHLRKVFRRSLPLLSLFYLWKHQ